MGSAQGRAGGSLLSRLTSGLNFSFGSGGSAVGLNIGASSVKIVELKKKKNAWILEKYSSVLLPEIASDQREIINPMSIAQAIQQAVKTSGIHSKDVCSSVVGSGLIIKTLSITVGNPKELEEQVFWEAEQYVPFDISEVVVDYQVLSKTKDGQYQVILVAVKKDFLEQYMGVIQDARLVPKVMDAEVFALQNVFECNYNVAKSEAMLLADVGAMSTKIMICAGGTPFLTKDTAFGGTLLTHEIQRDLKLSNVMDAEALKVSGNLPHEVAEVVNRVCQQLGIDLKKTIDFYTASSLGPPIGGILLSGGASRTAELTKIIEENTRLPTQILNPFQMVSARAGMTEDFLMSIAAEVVMPMGLAIRAGSPA